jgi:hypothetical protein
MPIPDTKYNYKDFSFNQPLYNRLQIDLCNNSFVYTNYIFTCDLSDTQTFDNPPKPIKIYLNSKASFLIHPFSRVSNCVTQFSSNNKKSAFKYKAPIPCPIDASSSHSIIQTQKAIQNVLHTSSSNFTQVLSTLTIAKDISSGRPWHNASDRWRRHGPKNNSSASSQKENLGVDIKHNSYARYLAKKKGIITRTQLSGAPIPIIGNKTKYYSISTRNNCTTDC